MLITNNNSVPITNAKKYLLFLILIAWYCWLNRVEAQQLGNNNACSCVEKYLKQNEQIRKQAAQYEQTKQTFQTSTHLNPPPKKISKSNFIISEFDSVKVNNLVRNLFKKYQRAIENPQEANIRLFVQKNAHIHYDIDAKNDLVFRSGEFEKYWNAYRVRHDDGSMQIRKELDSITFHSIYQREDDIIALVHFKSNIEGNDNVIHRQRNHWVRSFWRTALINLHRDDETGQFHEARLSAEYFKRHHDLITHDLEDWASSKANISYEPHFVELLGTSADDLFVFEEHRLPYKVQYATNIADSLHQFRLQALIPDEDGREMWQDLTNPVPNHSQPKADSSSNRYREGVFEIHQLPAHLFLANDQTSPPTYPIRIVSKQFPTLMDTAAHRYYFSKLINADPSFLQEDHHHLAPLEVRFINGKYRPRFADRDQLIFHSKDGIFFLSKAPTRDTIRYLNVSLYQHGEYVESVTDSLQAESKNGKMIPLENALISWVIGEHSQSPTSYLTYGTGYQLRIYSPEHPHIETFTAPFTVGPPVGSQQLEHMSFFQRNSKLGKTLKIDQLIHQEKLEEMHKQRLEEQNRNRGNIIIQEIENNILEDGQAYTINWTSKNVGNTTLELGLSSDPNEFIPIIREISNSDGDKNSVSFTFDISILPQEHLKNLHKDRYHLVLRKKYGNEYIEPVTIGGFAPSDYENKVKKWCKLTPDSLLVVIPAKSIKKLNLAKWINIDIMDHKIKVDNKQKIKLSANPLIDIEWKNLTVEAIFTDPNTMSIKENLSGKFSFKPGKKTKLFKWEIKPEHAGLICKIRVSHPSGRIAISDRFEISTQQERSSQISQHNP